METRASSRPLRVLTYTGPGPVVGHTLDDVRAGLVANGCDVFVQDIAGLERAGAPTAAIDVAIADGLVEVAPDLVLTVDTVGLVPAYVASLERPPACASWFFDDPIRCMRDTKMDFRQINGVYHVFSWDAAYLPSLRALGFANLHHLPLATNPDVYRPTRSGPAYEVSFVGTATEARRELLGRLARTGVRIDVFGRGWSAASAPGLRVHGVADARSECPAIFTRSKINLNATSGQLIESIPLRVFDVLACGGFLLTDLRADTERLFRPGDHFESYRGFGELSEKIRTLLPRASLRREIGAAGRAHVLAHFTFERQVARLLDRVRETQPVPVARDRARPEREALLGDWLVGLAYLKAGCPHRAEPLLARSGFGATLDALRKSGESEKLPWHDLYAPLGALPLGDGGRIDAARPHRIAPRAAPAA